MVKTINPVAPVGVPNTPPAVRRLEVVEPFSRANQVPSRIDEVNDYFDCRDICRAPAS
jgi:hypothetical protein